MDVNLLSQYQLIIKISDTGIVFLVSDTKDRKCLALEKYKFPTIATPESITISLQNIWDAHPFLNAGYWNKVVLLFSNLKFAYVPTALNDGNINPETFTHFNFKLAKNETLNSYRLSQLQTDCYFGINQEVISWFGDFYPSMITKITHASCAFLSGLQSIETKANHLHFYLSDNTITLANLKEGKLNYLNSFIHKTPEDILYTCTLVVDELNLDRKEVKLNFWGDYTDTDVILQNLRNYYPIVTTGSRPSHLTFSFQFDELQEYQHFDLLNATRLFV
jgi:hypothetical protein